MSAVQRSLISKGTAWISKAVLTALEDEANRMAPKETGGVLLGYWTEGPEEPVITHAVGPGSDAVHTRDRFIPDHEFHVAEIARLYGESKRMLRYLGDWHSHPDNSGAMSAKDRATLRRIAEADEARVACPLMLILGYGPVWEPIAWTLTESRWLRVLRRRCYERWDVQAFKS